MAIIEVSLCFISIYQCLSGLRNEMGEQVLTLADAYNLKIANTCFKKKDEHLITHKSGPEKTQIDFWLCSKEILKIIKDCKVIPGEAVIFQHRLLLLELKLKSTNKNKKDTIKPIKKIKWFKISKEPAFVNEMNNWLREDIQRIEDVSANDMWNRLEEFRVKRAGINPGIPKGKLKIKKESWWWSENVMTTIREKKDACKALSKCEDDQLT